jgi:hypothetical protein
VILETDLVGFWGCVPPAGLGNILGVYGKSEGHFGLSNNKVFVDVGCSDVFVMKEVSLS